MSLVLAIDISASMQAADVTPTRLAEAVRIARDILSEAEGTRVGLVLFAGKSYTLAPLTEDIGALRFLLEGVTPTIVSAQDPGSLLSAGIRSAGVLLRDEPVTTERAVVLITDGESGETDPEVIAAVREVAEVGASVHTIGVGTLRGGQMTLSGGNFPIGMQVRDLTGAPSVSRLQETLLQRISQVGQGEYAHAEDRGALGGVYRSLRPSAFSGASMVAGAGSDPSAALARVGLFLLFLEGLLELRLRRKQSGEGGGA
jgi:Ca-activated chloride channel family protein